MSTDRDAQLRFRFSPAFHRPDAQAIEEVALTFLGKKDRNPAQLGLLQRLGLVVIGTTTLPGSDPLLEQCACYAVAEPARQQARYLNGEPVFRDALYLFNVIIALEWNPSPYTYQQIRVAALRASDFLYDVTNGYMALGNIIIGGPDLMDAADIQVLASNRIHPRAWNAALNEAEKFLPIRVGRGLWQKNQETLLSWDNPDGYRSLVHEWGHYAFGLVDEYLKQVTLQRTAVNDAFWRPYAAGQSPPPPTVLELAAPDVALAVESVMADSRISEYAELPRIFGRIARYYPLVRDTAPLDGPVELPLALPSFLELSARPRPFDALQFSQTALNLDAGEDVVVSVTDAPSIAAVQSISSAAQAHWLYLLKTPFVDGLPRRVIAQGKVSRRDREQGFRLLGAAPGDRVLLVSQVGATASVHSAEVLSTGLHGSMAQLGVWVDATPPDGVLTRPFFVDVVPDPVAVGVTMHADVSVALSVDGPWPTDVAYFSSGGASGAPLALGTPQAGTARTASTPVPHLDGHVLLRWTGAQGDTDRYFICSSSQGGGGGKSSGGGFLPVTGGSADGNAMVFFNANIPLLAEPDASYPVGLRIVTTTLTVSQPGHAAAARSYIFGVASNQPLTADPASQQASLVLYFDRQAIDLEGDLLIYRWVADTQAWTPLTTFARPDLPYLAVPLGVFGDTELETAPALTRASWDGPRIEHFRICLADNNVRTSGKLPDPLP